MSEAEAKAPEWVLKGRGLYAPGAWFAQWREVFKAPEVQNPSSGDGEAIQADVMRWHEDRLAILEEARKLELLLKKSSTAERRRERDELREEVQAFN